MGGLLVTEELLFDETHRAKSAQYASKSGIPGAINGLCVGSSGTEQIGAMLPSVIDGGRWTVIIIL